ncbi:TSUP family transporter [uncultured Sharpea sp.]|uniref:sulfite exporter TauE/SafE family protein n=1 Tax=uncultured Sharpea sp. TaxID=1112738 RepID=UPI0025887FBB|nr:TSUP family transporter [uncultured Sharpea sp.]
MPIHFLTYIIVGTAVFIAGFVDAIAGGGGLISLPVYMMVGLPAHNAIATNKMSSTCGTALSTIRFIKNGLIHMKLALPSVFLAIIGSTIGAHLALMTNNDILEKIMIPILPITAFFVFNKNLFHDHHHSFKITRRTMLVSLLAAFIVGIYDGFYGPGTGTFLTVYLFNGQVIIGLGLFAALCNMAGNYLGSGMMMSKGSKVVKPVIGVVLVMLLLKMVHVY